MFERCSCSACSANVVEHDGNHHLQHESYAASHCKHVQNSSCSQTNLSDPAFFWFSLLSQCS